MPCRRTLLYSPLARHHHQSTVRRPLAAAADAAASAALSPHAHPPPRCQEAAEDPPAPLRGMATACPDQTHRPPLPPTPTPGRPQRWPNEAPCPCHASPPRTLDVKRRKAAGGMAHAHVQRLRLRPRSQPKTVHLARRRPFSSCSRHPSPWRTYKNTARTQCALYIQCFLV